MVDRNNFKDFISELAANDEVHPNAAADLRDFIREMRAHIKFNHSFELDSDYSDVNDKLTAVLRIFTKLYNKRNHTPLTLRKVVRVLRKSREPALQTPWTTDQIHKVTEMIYSGFVLNDVLSTDEENEDSDTDSAFSSDSN